MTKRPALHKRKQKKLIRAVPHIRLVETNPGKLDALDQLAQVYMDLCQQYVTVFCTEEGPDKYRAPLFATALSERWHRVAIQQAAGISQSWRTKRTNAYQAYLEDWAEYQDDQASSHPDAKRKEPTWTEWNIPTLRTTCIQANVNVVVLEPSEESTFDYWLKISTLERGKPLLVPVKLAAYHRKVLEGKTLNTSVTLHRRASGWWLTLSYDEEVPLQMDVSAPAVGVDVGIANFLTTSTGRHYGTFHGKLRERQKRDREKRRRKAKLRECLKKKGVKKLPSTSSRTGQRVARSVRQDINRAVNQMFADHPDAQLSYEQLSVASMRFHARAMNAYLHASNLAHIPEQLAWGAAKRGIQATWVKAAYSSQECSVCHYTDRSNRPNQQTFCCQVCHHSTHADVNAATNLARRVGDTELQACQTKADIKVLLLRRHAAYRVHHRLAVVQPPVQLSLFATSTDVG
jgi:hypothetical protein